MPKKTLIFASILLNVVLLYLSAHTVFDNSIWLGEDNQYKKNKNYIYNEFTRGEDLVIAIDLASDFFEAKYVNIFKELTKDLEEADGVVDVKNPLSVTTIIQHKGVMEIITFQDALEEGIIPNLKAYKKRFTESSYYGQLISKDYSKIALVIKIEAPLAEYNYQRRDNILKLTHNLLSKYLGIGQRDTQLSLDTVAKSKPASLHWTGEVALNHTLAKFAERDLSITLPLVLFLLFIFLYFVFRRLLEVIGILYISITVVTLSFATFVIFGFPMTAISISLPVLILSIAIADSIHIFNRWYEISTKISDVKLALKQTISETWSPCLVTSITTGIGFGCFYFSELIPLQNFGLVSLLVILSSYFIIVSYTWLFIYIFKERLKKDKIDLHPRLGEFLSVTYRKFTAPYRYYILTFFLLLMGASFYCLQFVRTETNFLDVFFKKSSTMYQDFEFVDAHLGGTGSVDIIVRAKDENGMEKLVSQEFVEKARIELSKHESINYIRSYLTPLKMLHKEFLKDLKSTTKNDLPKTQEQLSQEILFLEFSRGDNKNDVLSSYLDFDYNNSRIHIQTPNLDSAAAGKIKEHIKMTLNKLGASHNTKRDTIKKKGVYEYAIGGGSVYFQRLGDYVISTQLISILVTLGVIWIIFIIIFRFKLATIGVLINALPILLSCALIIYLDIPFDFATVLISSVSFGMCVDDTIHFLHFYKLQKKVSSNFHDCISNVIRKIGQPIFFTSVLFSSGFIVFVISDLVILIKFGVFTVITLIFAFIANVIVLPAILQLMDKHSFK